MARSKTMKVASDRKSYGRRYRASHPLLQGRVPKRIYDECQRRARANDFSLSKWLSKWLEFSLAAHPRTEDA